jgi:hypothetical protein
MSIVSVAIIVLIDWAIIVNFLKVILDQSSRSRDLAILVGAVIVLFAVGGSR